MVRTIDIANPTRPLGDYADELGQEAILVTRRGKVLAALVPMENVDLETFSLSTNPAFIALIERSRREEEAEGSISLEEIKAEFGLA